MRKGRIIKKKNPVPKKAVGLQDKKRIDTTFITAILLGLVLTLSAGTIIFVSFGDSTFMRAGNDKHTMIVTPLGFDLALLLIVMISAIIIILSTKKKESRK